MTDDGRRWVPEGGLQRYRDKIHRESKIADQKGLPYTISKPDKPKKHDYFSCAECGRKFSAPKNTIMCVCPDCKKVTKVERVEE